MPKPPASLATRAASLIQRAALCCWLLWLPTAAQATAYTFPGNLPGGCSGGSGAYTCNTLTLSNGDTVSVSTTTTITVNGNLNTNASTINQAGSTSALTLIVSGQLKVSHQAIVNANVTAGSVSDAGGEVTFGGSITTTTGTVSLGSATTVGGSIRTTSGTIALGGSNTITGSITSGSGSIDTGSASTIGGNVGTEGTVTVGQASTVAGTVTSRTSTVSIGSAARSTGDVTTHSGTLTLGSNSAVAACSRSTGSQAISLLSGATSSGVCCGTTCSNACVSNNSGAAMPASCAVAPFVAGTTYSFESWDTAGYYIRHSNYLGYISKIDSTSTSGTKQDATFTARAGRADSACWSFEAVNYPGYYLRHQNFVLKLQASDGSALFDKDTTFCQRTGLAGSGISLESVNYPGYYLRHDTSLALGIAYSDGSSAYRGQATFQVRGGLSSASVDHLEIRHGSGTGLTCTPSTLTVLACQDASCSTLYTSGLTGTLTATGTPSVVWPSGASFSISAGASSTTVNVQVTSAGSVVFGTTGLSVTPASSTSCNFGSPACTFTAADAGLLFDVPNHVAEASQAVTLTAVRKADNAAVCTPAFANVNKSLTFTCGYANPTSGTLPVRIGGKALNASNSATAACDSSGQAVTLAFDSTGKASTTLQYADVGQMNLTAKYVGSGSDAGLSMTGTDSFVAAPSSFAFSSITAAPIKAGNAFSATVTARNSVGNATPNFGKESTPASPTLSFTRYQPSSGSAGSFSGTLGSFSAGSATGSNLKWTEVGNGDLSATLTSYLSSGLNVTGTTGTTGAVGRFIPHHFDTTVSPACTGGAFYYAGQPITTTVTARNAGGAVTSNYAGATWAKATTLGDAGSLGLGGFNGTDAVAATAFSGGIASATPAYTFTNKLTAPQTLTLRATDADGVSSQPPDGTEGSTPLRSGRLVIPNGYGSEKSSLDILMRVEYWTGQAWLPSSTDTCTVIPASALALSNYRDYRGSAATWTTSGTVTSQGSGVHKLTLAAPSGAATGTVDIAINLGTGTADQSCNASHPATGAGSLAWLRSRNGSCAATWDRDPAARAAFGVYSAESKKTVHVRELF
ncbi:DUF6701 domain-containing protein [Ideonella sp. YS5]|uniref:DUF6701 domain-containing protein n=1 Tax=Ideonella sp. YS5 TaxID=3453714 RepID=UPI003EEAF1AA